MTTAEQARKIFESSLALIVERNTDRADVWRRSGARGMAVMLHAKSERILEAALRGDDGWERVVQAEGLDVINYAAFLLLQPSLNGDWPWQRTDPGPTDVESEGGL